MKTREEILAKHLNCEPDELQLFIRFKDHPVTQTLEAMEEYLNQYKEEQKHIEDKVNSISELNIIVTNNLDKYFEQELKRRWEYLEKYYQLFSTSNKLIKLSLINCNNI